MKCVMTEKGLPVHQMFAADIEHSGVRKNACNENGTYFLITSLKRFVTIHVANNTAAVLPLAAAITREF